MVPSEAEQIGHSEDPDRNKQQDNPDPCLPKSLTHELVTRIAGRRTDTPGFFFSHFLMNVATGRECR
jgi:hypothetical protein